MGERKGQLKWYPPDFDPKKHKSLDAYHGTHPLRERAKKLDKGILVIRFEMPYDIWCGGCGIHIAQSVRYNAEKSKVGMYYTTPIWKFRMRCHLCPQFFEIKTDPASHDYVIIDGARRKEKRWDPKENEQIVTDDKTDIKKMNADAMFKLEHGTDDAAKLKAKLPGLSQIEGAQSKWKDDYLLNTMARNMFRTEKKQIKAEDEKDLHLLKKSSLVIPLVKEHEDDVHMASLLKYSAVKTFDEKQAEKRQEIARRPIFSPITSEPISDVPEVQPSRDVVSQSQVPKHKPQLERTKNRLGLKASSSPFHIEPGKERKTKSFSNLNHGIIVKKTSPSTKTNSDNQETMEICVSVSNVDKTHDKLGEKGSVVSGDQQLETSCDSNTAHASLLSGDTERTNQNSAIKTSLNLLISTYDDTSSSNDEVD